MKDKLSLIGSILAPIALIFIIIFLFINTNDENSKSKDIKDEVIIDTTIEYPQWMTYIIDANIDSIVLSKTDEEDKQVTLTQEQLKEIFSGLLYENDEIIKLYSNSYGYVGGYDLLVSFTKDEKNYKFEIMNNMILCYDEESGRRDNQEFLSLIENSKMKVVNETGNDNLDNIDFVYKFENTKTFDKYLK